MPFQHWGNQRINSVATEGLQFKLLAPRHSLFSSEFGKSQAPGVNRLRWYPGSIHCRQNRSGRCWARLHVSMGVPGPAVLSWEGASHRWTLGMKAHISGLVPASGSLPMLCSHCSELHLEKDTSLHITNALQLNAETSNSSQ